MREARFVLISFIKDKNIRISQYCVFSHCTHAKTVIHEPFSVAWQPVIYGH
jgi:hypothetical protein